MAVIAELANDNLFINTIYFHKVKNKKLNSTREARL